MISVMVQRVSPYHSAALRSWISNGSQRSATTAYRCTTPCLLRQDCSFTSSRCFFLSSAGSSCQLQLHQQNAQKHTVDQQSLIQTTIVVSNVPSSSGTTIEWTYSIALDDDNIILPGPFIFAVQPTDWLSREDVKMIKYSIVAMLFSAQALAATPNLTCTLSSGDVSGTLSVPVVDGEYIEGWLEDGDLKYGSIEIPRTDPKPNPVVPQTVE